MTAHEEYSLHCKDPTGVVHVRGRYGIANKNIGWWPACQLNIFIDDGAWASDQVRASLGEVTCLWCLTRTS